MRTFIVSTDGENRLGLRDLCQQYCGEQWVADPFTGEQAAETLLEQFKRAVSAELQLLEPKPGEEPGGGTPLSTRIAGLTDIGCHNL